MADAAGAARSDGRTPPEAPRGAASVRFAPTPSGEEGHSKE
eukprot:gene7780-9022_t